MMMIATNAMMTGARAQFGIYLFSIIRPAQTGIQNVSKQAAVADLGSDPNSAQQSHISTQWYTELGSDPKVCGHWARPAPPAQPDTVASRRNKGCPLTINNIATNAYVTGARAQFGIYFLSIIRPAPAGTQNVSKQAAVAELGSDPNSAQQRQISTLRYTELGSDPNSAGHRVRPDACGANRLCRSLA